MLKKLLLAAALVVPMCLSAQSKFGYVSSIEIFNLMPEKATAEKSLQEVGQKYDTEFKALQDEFNKKFGEYQALAQDTPASIKERREQELQELQTKIQNFQQVAGQDLQRQQQILMAPIQEKIQTAIQSVGAENGFTLRLLNCFHNNKTEGGSTVALHFFIYWCPLKNQDSIV